jgi:hypothetical protein
MLCSKKLRESFRRRRWENSNSCILDNYLLNIKELHRMKIRYIRNTIYILMQEYAKDVVSSQYHV